jgi:peptide/nickel transport system substrate-binding protein
MHKPSPLAALPAAAICLAFLAAACGETGKPAETATPSGPAASAAGDASGSGAPAGAGASAGSGAPEKVLNFAVFSIIDTFEPTSASDSWYVVRIGAGETLVSFSPTMAAEPWLAESWTLSEDKLTWTFKIREEARFSNGNPLDGEAAKRSLERVARLAGDRFKSEFFEYESLEASGRELAIRTKVPVPGLPGMLADPLFLMTDVSAEPADVSRTGPVCTGPYRYLPRDGDNIAAVRNDFYWKGRPPLDRVNFVAVTDPNTRAMALQSGDVDIAANMSTTDMPIFLADPAFKVEEIESLRLVMAFMSLKGALADPALRRAVKSAMDLETWCRTLLAGRFTPGKGPLPPASGAGFAEAVDPYPYDMERARTILAEAGWADTDGDGVLDKDGTPAEFGFVFYADRAELPLLAEATQDSLARLGIRMSLDQVEYGSLATLRQNGDFGMLIMNILTAGTGDPQSFLVSQFETGAYNNSNGFSSPELDRALAELKGEFDPEKRSALIARARQAIMDDPAHVFYAYPNTNLVHSTKVTGVKMLPSDYYWVTFDIDKTP